MLKKLIALREESRRLDGGNKSTHVASAQEEHIIELYRLLGEDITEDPSIPPLNSIIPAPNAIPTSDPVMDSERLAMLLTLLDTTHSASTTSSRNVRSIADLTDAEFEELKSISAAQNLVFDDIMDR